MIEAAVLGKRLDAGRRVRIPAAAGRVRYEPRGLALCLLDQLKLLAWRKEQVCEPLEVLRSDPGRRQAEGQARKLRLERLVDALSRMAVRHLPGIGLLERRCNEQADPWQVPDSHSAQGIDKAFKAKLGA